MGKRGLPFYNVDRFNFLTGIIKNNDPTIRERVFYDRRRKLSFLRERHKNSEVIFFTPSKSVSGLILPYSSYRVLSNKKRTEFFCSMRLNFAVI